MPCGGNEALLSYQLDATTTDCSRRTTLTSGAPPMVLGMVTRHNRRVRCGSRVKPFIHNVASIAQWDGILWRAAAHPLLSRVASIV
jgi:hypothetical protein